MRPLGPMPRHPMHAHLPHSPALSPDPSPDPSLDPSLDPYNPERHGHLYVAESTEKAETYSARLKENSHWSPRSGLP